MSALKISGFVNIYEGVGEIDQSKKIFCGDNLILDSGKSFCLDRLFRPNFNPVFPSITHMAIGDGSYVFDIDGTPNGTPTFPQAGDIGLSNQLTFSPVSSPDAILQISSGTYQRSFLASFTSSQLSQVTTWSANNSNFFINESGLFCLNYDNPNNRFFSKYTMFNISMKPSESAGITIEWIIRCN